MKIKKLLTVMLTLILALSLAFSLASCGDTNDEDDNIVGDEGENGDGDEGEAGDGESNNGGNSEITPHTHTPSEAIIENRVESTCKVEGRYDEVVYCSECNDELSRTTKNIEIKEHNFSVENSIKVDACIENGSYTIRYCTECRTFTHSNKDAVLHAHSYVRKSNINKTSYWFECEKCGHKIGNEADGIVILSASHNFTVTNRVNPTCTQDGTYTLTCTKCNFKFVRIIPALGHNLVEDKILTEPTCTEKGEAKYKCTRCGYTENEDLPAIGHNYQEVEILVISPACNVAGTKKYKCSNCGDEKEEDYYAPHSFSDWECIQKEGCTQTGIYKRVCSVCSEADFNYINIHHQYGEGVITKEPTCTEKGSKLFTCALCGATNNEAIAQLEHDYKTLQSQEPTCTTSGYKIVICKRCGEVNYIYLNALGHKLEEVYDNNFHREECSRKNCNYKTTKEAHKLSVVSSTDEIDDGTQIMYRHTLKSTCSHCEYEIIHDTSELHIHYAVEIIDSELPTCTEGGYLPGLKCAIADCDMVLIEPEYQEPLGHLWESCNCIRCGETQLEMQLSADEKSYIVAGIGEYTGEEVVIPAKYKGLPVTEVAKECFMGIETIISVTIPSSVTSIGSFAFYGCHNLNAVYISDIASWCNIVFSINGSNPLYYAKYLYLNGELVTNLVIPDSVTSIGYSAFEYCYSLTSVTIPDSIKSIGKDAFYRCYKLNAVHISDVAAWCNIEFSNSTSNPLYYAKSLYINGELVTDLVIPSSFTSIGDYAFYGCTNLSSVTLLDRNSSIYVGKYAFPTELYNEYDNAYYLGNEDNPYLVLTRARDKEITSCDINTKTKLIADSAFGYCNNLANVIIPDSVTNIGYSSFADCDSLTSITIPDSVTSIGNCAFRWCGGLTSVTIGNSVTSIGEDAFYGCSSLASVTIPDSVTSIGEDAFYGCTSLTAVYIEDIAKWCNISFSGAYANPLSYAKNLYHLNGELVTNLVIPDSVTSIGDYAFYYCTSLTSVTIPDSVKSIGYDAFAYCKSLTIVTIGNSVTSIGERAFYDCYKLVEVINHSTLDIVAGFGTGIGSTDYGFVGYYARTVHNGESKIVNQDDYLFYTRNGVNYLVGYAGSDTELFLPESYKGQNYKIYKYAFYCCESLTNVTIPDSVTSIGDYAFKWCGGLTSVTIGNSVSSIGSDAFSGCTGLTSVTIPDSVTSIGEYAFSWCGGLTSVTIGKGVTRIGWEAFYECYKLVEIINHSTLDIIAGNSDYEYDYIGFYALTVHNGESKIVNQNDYLFYTHSSTNYLLGYVGNDKKLTLPESYKGQDYEIYKYAFCCCDSLTNVTIPDSITSIGEYAFGGCNNLKSITIPDSVTSIGGYAFYYCENLADVYYTGSEEEWAEIIIVNGNSSLTSATIHYNYTGE